MEQSPILSLPYIAGSQDQKHITHNEALQKLDVLTQLTVSSASLTTPPTDPAEGDRYIVAPSATDAWSARSGQIAAFQNGAWAFYAPQEGWRVWNCDEDQLLGWTGSGWTPVGGNPEEIQNANHVGVNASADDTNRLSVASVASLFTHEGAGHQIKVNKNTAGDTASLLYQTNWSGRAEMGLAGNDDFSIKVSPDGESWYTGLAIDKENGAAGIGRPSSLAKFSILQEGAGGVLSLDHYNDVNPANFTFLKARGSLATPEQLLANDRIGGFFARGHHDGGLGGNSAAFYIRALEDFTPTTQGSQIEFETTVSGSASRWPVLKINADDGLFPSIDNAYSVGKSGARWSAIWSATGTIQTSDAREKIKVGDLDHAALAMVKAVNPVQFKWKDGGTELVSEAPTSDAVPINLESKHEEDWSPVYQKSKPGKRVHAGFFAQDVKAALDAAGLDFGVWGLEDKTDPESRQFIRPDQLIPVLWATCQQLLARIEALESGAK